MLFIIFANIFAEEIVAEREYIKRY